MGMVWSVEIIIIIIIIMEIYGSHGVGCGSDALLGRVGDRESEWFLEFLVFLG